ncbi:MAG: signal transduction histidine kinase [Cellvibrionaceae bacterium]|jgi:signal transduction histidine kinase
MEIDTLKLELLQLQQENQRLRLMQNLSKALNRADGYEELSSAVLHIITGEIGFAWAVIGQVEADAQVLSEWVVSRSPGFSNLSPEVQTSLKTSFNKSQTIPLSTDGGQVGRAVLQNKPSIATDLAQFGPVAIHPLTWGGHPLGVLLIPKPPANQVSQLTNPLDLLPEVCEQMAIRLGVMQNRLRRARATAVEEERNRIAIDMHDTVSQSLFGMIFSLDACLKMRPEDPTLIYQELERIKTTAEGVHGEIRQTIHDMWVEMTAERFQHDIRSYLTDVLQAVELTVNFDVRGEFSAISPEVHRTLYRICQEALTNTVHHAAATDARVCLDVLDERVGLIVRDNGRGFDPLAALHKKNDEEHFGLRGIEERIRHLGGTCDFFSRPGKGMSLVVDVPAATKPASLEQ